MAQVQEEVVVIKLSKLVKNDDALKESLIGEEFESTVESIVQELVGSNVIVEVERA
jgi:hypothetical protein